MPSSKNIEQLEELKGIFENTDYLVSKRTDTIKADNARKYGTRVINESEMMAFVKAGKFPVRNLH